MPNRSVPDGVDPIRFARVEAAVRVILEEIGVAGREGCIDTPHRVAKYWLTEMNLGVDADPDSILSTTFNEPYSDELVIIRNIPLVSVCEHHLMAYTGHCHVGYIPEDGVVVGLSKIARLVDTLARQPSIQERLTGQVADVIDRVLSPKGVIVVVEATHTCMTLRGAHAVGSITTTSALRGVLLDPSRGARQEFLSLLHNGGGGR